MMITPSAAHDHAEWLQLRRERQIAAIESARVRESSWHQNFFFAESINKQTKRGVSPVVVVSEKETSFHVGAAFSSIVKTPFHAPNEMWGSVRKALLFGSSSTESTDFENGGERYAGSDIAILREDIDNLLKILEQHEEGSALEAGAEGHKRGEDGGEDDEDKDREEQKDAITALTEVTIRVCEVSLLHFSGMLGDGNDHDDNACVAEENERRRKRCSTVTKQQSAVAFLSVCAPSMVLLAVLLMGLIHQHIAASASISLGTSPAQMNHKQTPTTNSLPTPLTMFRTPLPPTQHTPRSPQCVPLHLGQTPRSLSSVTNAEHFVHKRLLGDLTLVIRVMLETSSNRERLADLLSSVSCSCRMSFQQQQHLQQASSSSVSSFSKSSKCLYCSSSESSKPTPALMRCAEDISNKIITDRVLSLTSALEAMTHVLALERLSCDAGLVQKQIGMMGSALLTSSYDEGILNEDFSPTMPLFISNNTTTDELKNAFSGSPSSLFSLAILNGLFHEIVGSKTKANEEQDHVELAACEDLLFSWWAPHSVNVLAKLLKDANFCLLDGINRFEIRTAATLKGQKEDGGAAATSSPPVTVPLSTTVSALLANYIGCAHALLAITGTRLMNENARRETCERPSVAETGVFYSFPDVANTAATSNTASKFSQIITPHQHQRPQPMTHEDLLLEKPPKVCLKIAVEKRHNDFAENKAEINDDNSETATETVDASHRAASSFCPASVGTAIIAGCGLINAVSNVLSAFVTNLVQIQQPSKPDSSSSSSSSLTSAGTLPSSTIGCPLLVPRRKRPCLESTMLWLNAKQQAPTASNTSSSSGSDALSSLPSRFVNCACVLERIFFVLGIDESDENSLNAVVTNAFQSPDVAFAFNTTTKNDVRDRIRRAPLDIGEKGDTTSPFLFPSPSSIVALCGETLLRILGKRSSFSSFSSSHNNALLLLPFDLSQRRLADSIIPFIAITHRLQQQSQQPDIQTGNDPPDTSEDTDAPHLQRNNTLISPLERSRLHRQRVLLKELLKSFHPKDDTKSFLDKCLGLGRIFADSQSILANITLLKDNFRRLASGSSSSSQSSEIINTLSTVRMLSSFCGIVNEEIKKYIIALLKRFVRERILPSKTSPQPTSPATGNSDTKQATYLSISFASDEDQANKKMTGGGGEAKNSKQQKLYPFTHSDVLALAILVRLATKVYIDDEETAKHLEREYAIVSATLAPHQKERSHTYDSSTRSLLLSALEREIADAQKRRRWFSSVCAPMLVTILHPLNAAISGTSSEITTDQFFSSARVLGLGGSEANASSQPSNLLQLGKSTNSVDALRYALAHAKREYTFTLQTCLVALTAFIAKKESLAGGVAASSIVRIFLEIVRDAKAPAPAVGGGGGANGGRALFDTVLWHRGALPMMALVTGLWVREKRGEWEEEELMGDNAVGEGGRFGGDKQEDNAAFPYQDPMWSSNKTACQHWLRRERELEAANVLVHIKHSVLKMESVMKSVGTSDENGNSSNQCSAVETTEGGRRRSKGPRIETERQGTTKTKTRTRYDCVVHAEPVTEVRERNDNSNERSTTLFGSRIASPVSRETLLSYMVKKYLTDMFLGTAVDGNYTETVEDVREIIALLRSEQECFEGLHCDGRYAALKSKENLNSTQKSDMMSWLGEFLLSSAGPTTNGRATVFFSRNELLRAGINTTMRPSVNSVVERLSVGGDMLISNLVGNTTPLKQRLSRMLGSSCLSLSPQNVSAGRGRRTHGSFAATGRLTERFAGCGGLLSNEKSGSHDVGKTSSSSSGIFGVDLNATNQLLHHERQPLVAQFTIVRASDGRRGLQIDLSRLMNTCAGNESNKSRARMPMYKSDTVGNSSYLSSPSPPLNSVSGGAQFLTFLLLPQPPPSVNLSKSPSALTSVKAYSTDILTRVLAAVETVVEEMANITPSPPTPPPPQPRSAADLTSSPLVPRSNKGLQGAGGGAEQGKKDENSEGEKNYRAVRERAVSPVAAQAAVAASTSPRPQQTTTAQSQQSRSTTPTPTPPPPRLPPCSPRPKTTAIQQQQLKTPPPPLKPSSNLPTSAAHRHHKHDHHHHNHHSHYSTPNHTHTNKSPSAACSVAVVTPNNNGGSDVSNRALHERKWIRFDERIGEAMGRLLDSNAGGIFRRVCDTASHSSTSSTGSGSAAAADLPSRSQNTFSFLASSSSPNDVSSSSSFSVASFVSSCYSFGNDSKRDSSSDGNNRLSAAGNNTCSPRICRGTLFAYLGELALLAPYDCNDLRRVLRSAAEELADALLLSLADERDAANRARLMLRKQQHQQVHSTEEAVGQKRPRREEDTENEKKNEKESMPETKDTADAGIITEEDEDDGLTLEALLGSGEDDFCTSEQHTTRKQKTKEDEELEKSESFFIDNYNATRCDLVDFFSMLFGAMPYLSLTARRRMFSSTPSSSSARRLVKANQLLSLARTPMMLQIEQPSSTAIHLEGVVGKKEALDACVDAQHQLQVQHSGGGKGFPTSLLEAVVVVAFDDDDDDLEAEDNGIADKGAEEESQQKEYELSSLSVAKKVYREIRSAVVESILVAVAYGRGQLILPFVEDKDNEGHEDTNASEKGGGRDARDLGVGLEDGAFPHRLPLPIEQSEIEGLLQKVLLDGLLTACRGSNSREGTTKDDDTAFLTDDVLALPREHLYLCFEKCPSLERLPWEALDVCWGHPISRIPSHEWITEKLSSMQKEEECGVPPPPLCVAPPSASERFNFLLDPAGDLTSTRRRFVDFFGANKLKGVVGPLIGAEKESGSAAAPSKASSSPAPPAKYTYQQHQITVESYTKSWISNIMPTLGKREIVAAVGGDCNNRLSSPLSSSAVLCEAHSGKRCEVGFFAFIGHGHGRAFMPPAKVAEVVGVIAHSESVGSQSSLPMSSDKGVGGIADYLKDPEAPVMALMGCESARLVTVPLMVEVFVGGNNDDAKQQHYCSSNHLQLPSVKSRLIATSPPSGVVRTYLEVGSPAVVGCLWTVTDKQLDKLTKQMLMGVFGFTDPDEEDNATRKKTTFEKQLCCRSLAASLAAARRAAKQRFGIGGATVMYGLPMLTAAEADRLARSLKLKKDKEQQRINSPMKGDRQRMNGGNATTEASSKPTAASTFASPPSKSDHIIFDLDVEDEETTIKSGKIEKSNSLTCVFDTSLLPSNTNDTSVDVTLGYSTATTSNRDKSQQPTTTTTSAPRALVVQREDMRRVHQEDEEEGDELCEKYAVCVVADGEAPSPKHCEPSAVATAVTMASKTKKKEENEGEGSSTPLAPLRTTIGPVSSYQEEPTKQLAVERNASHVWETKESKKGERCVGAEDLCFDDDDDSGSQGRLTVAYKFKQESYSVPPPQQTQAGINVAQTTSDSSVTNATLPTRILVHAIGQKRLERSPAITSLDSCHEKQQEEQHLLCQPKHVFQVDADEESVAPAAVLKRIPRTELRAVVAASPTVSAAVLVSASQSGAALTNTTCLPRDIPAKDGGKSSANARRARCHDARGRGRTQRKGIVAVGNEEEDEEDDFSLGALLAAGGSVGRISPPPPPLVSSRALSRSPPLETPSRPLIYSQQDNEQNSAF